MFRVGATLFVCLFLSLTAPIAHADSCAKQVAQQAPVSTFGWEVEYVPGENPGLWELYRPEGIVEADWADRTPESRDEYVKAHAKEFAPTMRTPCALVRRAAAPGFLPERLIMDETGNWEIIGGVTSSFEAMKAEISQVEATVQPGSYQAHVALPISRLEKGAAGYTLFSADLLTLRKLTSQLSRYAKDPKSVPGAFFLHPFLSVYTKLKKEMLVAVMNANLSGLGWESVLPAFRAKYPELAEVWRENRPYYKYTLANTFRTDIYGNQGNQLVRFGFEVRGSHKSLESLLTETRALDTLGQTGFKGFDRFLAVDAMDPDLFQRFPEPMQTLLNKVIPEGEVEDPRPRYFAFLFRPFEQYSALLNLTATESADLRRRILVARTEALNRLQETAQKLEAGGIDEKAARSECLVVLAKFAAGMDLLSLMERYLSLELGGALPASSAKIAG